MSRQLSQRLSQKGHQGAGPLFRNKTNRWRVATKKVRIGVSRLSKVRGCATGVTSVKYIVLCYFDVVNTRKLIFTRVL